MSKEAKTCGCGRALEPNEERCPSCERERQEELIEYGKKTLAAAASSVAMLAVAVLTKGKFKK